MKWSDDQLQQYHDQGYLFVKNMLSAQELAAVQAAMPALLEGEDSHDQMHRERERSGALRQVYLAHRYNDAFKALSRNSKLVDPVRQVLGGDVYIWHSKLNVKDAFAGTVWLWHQDYGYWMWDGVQPKLVSVVVFLDRSTLTNGCLMAVAGSHKLGRLEHYPDEVTTSYKQWCIDKQTLSRSFRDEQIQYITAEPGDAFFFHCNLIHGSGHNMSPLPRNVYIIAYNHIDNRPAGVENPRPDWVVSRDFDVVR